MIRFHVLYNLPNAPIQEQWVDADSFAECERIMQERYPLAYYLIGLPDYERVAIGEAVEQIQEPS